MNNLDKRLAGADPARRLVLDPLPEEALRAMIQEIAMTTNAQISQPRPGAASDIRATRARRRRRRLLAGAVATAIVSVPTAAVAVAVGGMHSGFFGGANDTEDVPGEEWLYADSLEIRDTVQDLSRHVPLPPGVSYDPLLARYPRSNREGREMVQRTGLAQEVQFYAVCAWYRDWDGGDAARKAAAVPTLEAIPTWEHWRFAKDDLTGEDPGRDLLRKIASEAEAGNPSTLRLYLRANC